jgi:hypothetical protein
MIVTLVVLVIASLLMAAAFAAANGDIHLTRTDTSTKKAYYAAQAGVSDYLYHLNTDLNYWTYCTGGTAAENHSLNLEIEKGKPFNKVPVPGASEEEYAIQMLHATTAPSSDLKCDPLQPVSTMIESGSLADGTFRIASTGLSGGHERTIVATLGHSGFLDFIYYTKYETLDPVTYNEPAAYAVCAQPRASRPAKCGEIHFIDADKLNGPIHTEDTAVVCSKPTFGRGPQDLIEFKGGAVAGGGGCTESATYLGTVVPKSLVQSIEPPPSDTQLRSIVEPAYHFLGRTVIALTGGTMTITNALYNGGVKKENVPMPPNGVIYVSNIEGGCPHYSPYSPTTPPYTPITTRDPGCNVYVSGNYTGQLTIASENDIVINGSITTPTNIEGVPNTNAVLGLIADNFVRVYHPVTETYAAGGASHNQCGSSDKFVGSGTCLYQDEEGGCDAPLQNAAEDPNHWGAQKNLTIYAAILAVNHSFIVDNYGCPPSQETLKVYGAIAQIFRGTVGTHSGSEVYSGYAKNYIYDDRLQVESPPHFLNPIESAWHIKRETLGTNPE